MLSIFSVSIILNIFIFILVIAAIAFSFVSKWLFFKKCGEEGWKSLIPFYSDYVLVQISGLNWWWMLLLYVNIITNIISSFSSLFEQFDSIVALSITLILAIIGLVGTLMVLFTRFNINYNISKKLNQNIWYAILLTIFPSIMYFIIGLSKEFKFDKNIMVSKNGVFNINKNTN